MQRNIVGNPRNILELVAGSRNLWLAALLSLVMTATSLAGDTRPSEAQVVLCTTTCFVATTGNDANGGTSFADAFLTIQKGLDTVQPGGTVNVGAGTFTTSSSVPVGAITKSVSLRGSRFGVDARNRSGSETSISVPSSNATGGFTVSGSGLNVTIDGFRFISTSNGAGNAVLTLAGLSGTLNVSNNIVTNIANNTSASTLRGIDATQGTAALTADQNYLDRVGNLSAISSNGRGIIVGTTGTGAPATITNNLIAGGGNSFARQGIALGGNTVGSNIHHNLIAGSTSGSSGIVLSSTVAAGSILVNRNSITNNTSGNLTNSTANTVDATCNYWGSASGPGATITGSQAAMVDADPWLQSNDLAGDPCVGTTGAPVPANCTTTCYVSVTGHDGNSGVDFAHAMRNIQAAIDRVSAGGTINVAPGLYNPLANTPPTAVANINTVTKSVTINGAKMGIAGSTAGRNPNDSSTESIIQATQGLTVNGAHTVIVDGFSFQGNTPNTASGVSAAASMGGGGVNATVTVRNNIFFSMNFGTSATVPNTDALASDFDIRSNLYTGGNTGIQVGGGATATPALVATLAIADNVFTGLAQKAIDANVWKGAQITGNTISNTNGNPPLGAGGCIDCLISNNAISNSGGASSISVFGFNGSSSGTTISNNNLGPATTANNAAIFIGAANGTQVTGNTISGARQTGIGVNPTASDTNVANNTISGATATGIHAGQGFVSTPGSGITLQNNTITGIPTGIQIDRTTTATLNTISGSSTVAVNVGAANTDGTLINRNSLASNTAGLTSATATPVNAECNWWGAADGPSGSGPGSGTSVSANADFTPWLTTSDLNGACKNFTTITTDLDNDGPLTVGQSTFDRATLAGHTPTAGGTVTYRIYSNNTCTALVADVTPSPNTVTNGAIPDSNSHTFNTAGTYYWQAVYSGDANNQGASSVCTSETLIVNAMAVFTVTKVYSPPGGPQVTITLSCNAGAIVDPTPDASTNTEPATEASPAVFHISGLTSATTCTAFEGASPGTPPPGYTAMGCSGPQPVNPGQQDAGCTITNSLTSATITVTKQLVPGTDPAKFNLQVDGTTRTPAGGVGHGGSTPPVTVSPGVHSVGETMEAPATAAQFWSSISCRSGGGTGPEIATGAGTSLSFNVPNLAQVVCVISNMRIPAQCTAPGVITRTGTAGNDVFSITEAGGTVFVDALAGNDTVIVTGGATVCVNAGDGNDTVSGRNGDDVIFGGNGNDNLRGGGGNDTIVGAGGSDSILGEGGSDAMHGGDGNDNVNGGDGADTADGGPGTDTCAAETKANCEP